MNETIYFNATIANVNCLFYFRYILVAVIDYIATNDKSLVGHYVAYCHRIKGYWEYHNDLFTERPRINPNTKNVQPHLLFYIRDDKYEL